MHAGRGTGRGTGRPVGPSAAAQVGAVLELRIAALRGTARRRAAVGTALVPAAVGSALALGAVLPRDDVDDLQLLLPSAWLFFAVAALLAAATGAGGRELLPREQAVAFPLSPAADHLGALLLTPLNLSWLVQATFLLGATSWVVGPSAAAVPAVALTLLWIVASTVTAAAGGWVVEIARTTRAGIWGLRALLVLGGAAVLTLVATGRVVQALDAAPTTGLVVVALAAGRGNLSGYAAAALGLAAVTAVTFWVGLRLAAVLHRRPPRAQVQAEGRSWRRRPDPASDLRAALRVDHASVWRSAPLRRGILVLGAIPGAAAAVSGLDWSMVTLLPGLVASGAALLFGVNAFCLDGPGAPWRETLPGAPRTLLAARLLLVAEVCLAGGAVALAAACLRAPGPPDPAEAVAVLAVLVVTTAQVVARCAVWSVHRPYTASLRDPRDQPAPPAAMAGYSARLAITTTFTGLLFSLLAVAGEPLVTLLVAAGLVGLPALRIRRVARLWDDAAVRTRVLATVAGATA